MFAACLLVLLFEYRLKYFYVCIRNHCTPINDLVILNMINVYSIYSVYNNNNCIYINNKKG